MKQTHEGYVGERQRGKEVEKPEHTKKEEIGDRGCIAMSVKRVTESPETEWKD